MSKIKLRGGTLLAPVPPVMVSCGDMEQKNILTVAWTGITNTVPPKTYISVRPSRHSYGIIKERGEFVLNLTPTSLVRTADYCGIYTGAKVDKFEKCHLTPVPAEELAAPMIAECPISICCRVTDVIPLGSHDMFLADILAVYADESLMDQSGKLHLEKADLCAYAHGDYYALGRILGHFGFSAAKKKKKRQAPPKSK
ncbi:MAG: flavin reductase family protein [Clostridia bacterium]|nr:flavin reductase family protein [Clostridia bacterium]